MSSLAQKHSNLSCWVLDPCGPTTLFWSGQVELWSERTATHEFGVVGPQAPTTPTSWLTQDSAAEFELCSTAYTRQCIHKYFKPSTPSNLGPSNQGCARLCRTVQSCTKMYKARKPGFEFCKAHWTDKGQIMHNLSKQTPKTSQGCAGLCKGCARLCKAYRSEQVIYYLFLILLAQTHHNSYRVCFRY